MHVFPIFSHARELFLAFFYTTSRKAVVAVLQAASQATPEAWIAAEMAPAASPILPCNRTRPWILRMMVMVWGPKSASKIDHQKTIQLGLIRERTDSNNSTTSKTLSFSPGGISILMTLCPMPPKKAVVKLGLPSLAIQARKRQRMRQPWVILGYFGWQLLEPGQPGHLTRRRLLTQKQRTSQILTWSWAFGLWKDIGWQHVTTRNSHRNMLPGRWGGWWRRRRSSQDDLEVLESWNPGIPQKNQTVDWVKFWCIYLPTHVDSRWNANLSLSLLSPITVWYFFSILVGSTSFFAA